MVKLKTLTSANKKERKHKVMMIKIHKPICEDEVLDFLEKHPIKKVIFDDIICSHVSMRVICENGTDLGIDMECFDCRCRLLFWNFQFDELYLMRVNGTFSPDPIRIKNKELINFFREGIVQECENEKIRKENEFSLALFPEREGIDAVTEINGVLFEKRDTRDMYNDYEHKGE